MLINDRQILSILFFKNGKYEDLFIKIKFLTVSYVSVCLSLGVFSCHRFFFYLKHRKSLETESFFGSFCFSHSEVTYEAKPLMWIKSMTILIWAFHELPIQVIITFQGREDMP